LYTVRLVDADVNPCAIVISFEIQRGRQSDMNLGTRAGNTARLWSTVKKTRTKTLRKAGMGHRVARNSLNSGSVKQQCDRADNIAVAGSCVDTNEA
jgi:hypothetical protein